MCGQIRIIRGGTVKKRTENMKRISRFCQEWLGKTFLRERVLELGRVCELGLRILRVCPAMKKRKAF